jgi:hypothetical protein
VYVQHAELQSVLRAGLMYSAGVVTVRRPGAAAPGQALANLMFPVINYPTHVTLQVERQILEVVDAAGETVHVAYVGLRAVVLAYMPHELLDEDLAAWFEQHPDVRDLLPADAELTVFGVDSTLVADSSVISSASVPAARVRRWGVGCRFLLERSDGVRWCNSVGELRRCLAGLADASPETSPETSPGTFLDDSAHLICEDCEFDKDDLTQNMFWPVRADMTVCMLRENSALAAASDALAKQLARAELQLQQTRDRVDVLSTQTGPQVESELAQHRAVLERRSTIVQDLQARLAQVSVEPAVVTLSLNAHTISAVRVVHKTFEPFEPGSGAVAETACLEAWDSQQFLQEGHYRIRLPVVSTPSATEFHDFPMDFVSVSRCMWTEGQPLFLDVGVREYAQIMALFPGLRVADPRLHARLTADEDEDDGADPAASSIVQFRCHYVLSHGSRVSLLQHAESRGDPSYWARHEPKNALQMGVQLLLPVQVCSADVMGGSYHDREENQYMLHARLYKDGEMRVHPYPRQGRNVVVCEVFEYRHEYSRCAASVGGAPVDIEPGESAVWYHVY